MRGFALSVLVVVAILSPLRAQKPIVPPPETPIPDGNSRGKSKQIELLVTGCIRGRRLQVSDLHTRDSVFDSLRVSEFILEGPRELLRQIKDYHDGHNDQIEGIVTVPPPITGGSSTVTTKKFGKARVTLGGREEGKAYVEEPTKPLTLKVASLTHLNGKCVGR